MVDLLDRSQEVPNKAPAIIVDIQISKSVCLQCAG
eukprot:COSAG03_NODE_17405_length_376_cov_0.927798_2_plen_34_part_01